MEEELIRYMRILRHFIMINVRRKDFPDFEDGKWTPWVSIEGMMEHDRIPTLDDVVEKEHEIEEEYTSYYEWLKNELETTMTPHAATMVARILKKFLKSDKYIEFLEQEWSHDWKPGEEYYYCGDPAWTYYTNVLKLFAMARLYLPEKVNW